MKNPENYLPNEVFCRSKKITTHIKKEHCIGSFMHCLKSIYIYKCVYIFFIYIYVCTTTEIVITIEKNLQKPLHRSNTPPQYRQILENAHESV